LRFIAQKRTFALRISFSHGADLKHDGLGYLRIEMQRINAVNRIAPTACDVPEQFKSANLDEACRALR